MQEFYLKLLHFCPLVLTKLVARICIFVRRSSLTLVRPGGLVRRRRIGFRPAYILAQSLGAPVV